MSFGPIVDLSAPDGLLVVGGVAINLLPILMTVINVVSSSIYLKGFPLKTKVQLYGIALVFFVLEMLVGDRRSKRHLFQR